MSVSVTLRKCHDCPAMTERSRCPRCAAKQVKYLLTRQKRLRKEGRCSCGRPRGTTKLCEDCRLDQRDRLRNERKTKTYNKVTNRYE